MAQKAKEKNTTAKKSGKSRVDNTVKNPNEQPEKKSLEKDSPIDEQHTDQVEETGSVLTTHKDSVIHCLTIIGQIEGHYILPQQNKTTKYEHVIPLLVSIEEDERIDGLLILINTVGGDVEAGLAIAEVISGMKKPTVSIVLGGGHRHTACRCGRQEFYCTECVYDGASCANYGTDARRSADF